jgi:hypothetical protein
MTGPSKLVKVRSEPSLTVGTPVIEIIDRSPGA